MHRDVAIEFARWLNPLFAIWCNDRFFELVNHGSAQRESGDINSPEILELTRRCIERKNKELEEIMFNGYRYVGNYYNMSNIIVQKRRTETRTSFQGHIGFSTQGTIYANVIIFETKSYFYIS